jgi:hypothetical protein
MIYYQQPGSVGGGGMTGPLSISWGDLSKDCQQGLIGAMPGPDSFWNNVDRLLALVSAWGAESTLEAATSGTTVETYNNISWTLLAAIGIQETGFQDKNEKDGGGVGVGVFQITIPSPTITAAGANNLATAASWLLNFLDNNETTIIGGTTGVSESDLLWMVAASVNTGAQGQINRWLSGESPDYHTSPNSAGGFGNNYGQNVLNIMDCFR